MRKVIILFLHDFMQETSNKMIFFSKLLLNHVTKFKKFANFTVTNGIRKLINLILKKHWNVDMNFGTK